MDNDLISRSALKEAIKQEYDDTLDGIVKYGIEKVYNLVDDVPTVESPCTQEQFDEMCENLAFYINERNRLLKELRRYKDCPLVQDECFNCGAGCGNNKILDGNQEV